MNKSTNANSALVSYIDALLFEESAEVIIPDVGKVAPPVRPVEKIGNGEEIASVKEVDSDPKLIKLLLFRVAGIPLAISHDVVANIVEVARDSLDGVVAKDGYIAWEFMQDGIMVRVIDTRTVILPNGHPGRETNEAKGKAQIIVFNDFPYGLMCDEVAETVEVRHQDIDWRSQRSTRLWLAGMVKGHNHAMLDVAEIINIGNHIIS